MAALEASIARTGRVTARAPEPAEERVAARSVAATRHIGRVDLPPTKAELMQQAKDRGLKVSSKATKNELEELLQDADDTPETSTRAASRA